MAVVGITALCVLVYVLGVLAQWLLVGAGAASAIHAKEKPNVKYDPTVSWALVIGAMILPLIPTGLFLAVIL